MSKFLSRTAGAAALVAMTMSGWWTFQGSPLASRQDAGSHCRLMRDIARGRAYTPIGSVSDRITATQVCPEEPTPWDSDLITRSMVAAGLAVALAGLSMRLGERAREH